MEAKKIHYAVVGLKHGQEHVEAILKNSRAELVACCDLIFNSVSVSRYIHTAIKLKFNFISTQ